MSDVATNTPPKAIDWQSLLDALRSTGVSHPLTDATAGRAEVRPIGNPFLSRSGLIWFVVAADRGTGRSTFHVWHFDPDRGEAMSHSSHSSDRSALFTASGYANARGPENGSLHAGMPVKIDDQQDSEYAGLAAVVIWGPDEDNSSAHVRIDQPGHSRHAWRTDVEARHLSVRSETAGEQVASTDPELLAQWNASSVTGGVDEGAQADATVDGTRVIAVYVEDHQSDEYARMFECFFPDGSIDYVSEDDIELDDDTSGEVSDDYRGDQKSCIADRVHLTSTDDDGYCNACGHQADDTEEEG